MSTQPKTPTRFQKVLLATDFSECAEAAFPYALALAQRYGGVLYLAHVTTPDMYGYAPEESAPEMFQKIRSHARERMAAFTGRMNFQGVPWVTLFGEGEVWDTLEQMIAEHGIDLIVASTRGRRGLRKLVMGSVAEEILRLATCPVLTVGPHSPAPGKGIANILYPTDFSEHAQTARDCALSLARQFHSTLIALHVCEAQIADMVRRRREDELLVARLQKHLAVDPSSLPLALHIHYGHPGEEILRAAAEYHADLIVMHVRGAGALPRLSTAFGSIAHHVVSHAACPVLTIRG
jgi:nucleotide-binding universal stress UspA family protein